MDDLLTPSRRQLAGGALAVAAALVGSPRQAEAAPAAKAVTATRRGNYVLRGGHVISVDPAIGDLSGGDVHIRDGVIVAVANRIAAPGADVIDARNTIVMPGFIEVHWHMWNSLWRGMAHDAKEYFALQSLARFYTAEDHYTAVRYAAAEAINGGITTCHDWAHGIRDFDDAEAEMRALVDCGIRARFGYGATAFGATQQLERAQGWLAERGDGGRVSLGLVVRNAETLPAEAAAARKLGLKTIGTHGDHSARPEAGPDLIFTHGAGMPRAALARIAAARMKVGLCPQTDPLIGAGLPPLFQMLDAGVRFEDIGFSVDVNCQTAADPFAAMRIMMYSARIAQNQAAGSDSFASVSAGRQAPQLMMPRKLIEVATINGARVLGLDAVTGSLTPGKRADVIMVRTDQANMLPAENVNPTLQLVQHGQPANVDTVIVDGRILKRGGKLIGIDAAKLSMQAADAQKAIRARAKLPPINATI